MPEATVLNEALNPAQSDWSPGVVAAVLVLMVRVAQLVTLLQLPLTITQ